MKLYALCLQSSNAAVLCLTALSVHCSSLDFRLHGLRQRCIAHPGQTASLVEREDKGVKPSSLVPTEQRG